MKLNTALELNRNKDWLPGIVVNMRTDESKRDDTETHKIKCNSCVNMVIM